MPNTTAPVDIDYDCEFATTNPVIDLVSIALADSSTGATYYAINAACDRDALLTNPWLMDNVVPTLPLTRGTDGVSDLLLWDPDLPDFDKVKSRAQIATEIRDFVLGTDPDNPRPVRLWADYGAYDHVALCQLFGTMTDLPAGFPMWTHDLRQEIERLGLTDADLPQQQTGQHNALADALHQQAVRHWIETTHVPVRVLGTDMSLPYGVLTESKVGRPLTEAERHRGEQSR